MYEREMTGNCCLLPPSSPESPLFYRCFFFSTRRFIFHNLVFRFKWASNIVRYSYFFVLYEGKKIACLPGCPFGSIMVRVGLTKKSQEEQVEEDNED